MSAAESRQMDASHAGVGSVEWGERLRSLCLQGPFSWWELGNEPWFLAGILSPPGGSAVLNSTQAPSFPKSTLLGLVHSSSSWPHCMVIMAQGMPWNRFSVVGLPNYLSLCI